MKTLRDEIRQTRPFQSPEQEALLNIERTAAVIGHRAAEWLRQYGVTPTQYNVLRILRGAGEGGLCRHEIRSRMLRPVPDVTRLLDRLEELDMVGRERDASDRRQVRTIITRTGLALLERLDGPIIEFERRQIGHMSQTDLRTLIRLLSEVRARPG